ncbi:hypothetical protein [Haliscomenobacter sp.]|uniref:hypothetical protein n=1 Tax=Haliscomenobacter sp. TaxID=2717303 RepID=UPI0033652CBA
MDVHFYCFGGKNRDKNGGMQGGRDFGVKFTAWAVKKRGKVGLASNFKRVFLISFLFIIFCGIFLFFVYF